MNVSWWVYSIIAGVCVIVAIATELTNAVVIAKRSEDHDRSIALNFLTLLLIIVACAAGYRAGTMINLWASFK